jgi:hypothetical protein
MASVAGAAGCGATAYLSSFTLRRGRRANHQMLAMVARTPKAAAGLATLRERSDMALTLPGGPDDRAVRRARRCSHVLLLIFFAFSYPILGFLLRANYNMGDMQRSTFRTSPNQRLRRRTDGPALILIVGSAGVPCTSIRDARPTHPGQEDFTPDGIPSDSPGSAVHNCEPGSSPFASRSRGNTALDTDGLTSSGSVPNDDRGMSLHLTAQFCELHASNDIDAAPDTEIRLTR